MQKSVNRLLHELAPERAAARANRLPVRVEQHRTPSGCVLQAAAAAVSVSWFADAADDAVLGELQVVLWRGVVTRRGGGRKSGGAEPVRRLVLRPAPGASDEAAWQAPDGTTYDTEGLAAHCLALLEEQISAEERGPDAATT